MRLDLAFFQSGNTGQRRRLLDQRGGEQVELFRSALHLDHDAAGVVAYEAAELLGARQAVDEGPKADPLHDPADAHAPSLRHALTTLR